MSSPLPHRWLIAALVLALAAAPASLAAAAPGPTDQAPEGLDEARSDPWPAPQEGCQATDTVAQTARIALDARILPRTDEPGATTTSHDRLDTCIGIRPGGALVLKAGGFELAYCTMAFIITDGTDLYVATAGHCVDEELGVPTEDIQAHGVDEPIGDLAYQWCEGSDSLGQGCDAGTDFALIRLNEEVHDEVEAAMCHWGAPTGGIFEQRDTQPRTVQHFGWGMVLGEPASPLIVAGNPATQDREGIGVDFSQETYALVESPASSGDSGSGVLVDELDTPLQVREDPQALGVLTHVSATGVIVQFLDESLAKAEQALDDVEQLELVAG